jgi:MFS family permease
MDTSVRNADKLPARAWMTVGLLCIVGALNYLDRTTVTTMRVSILSAIPMSDAKFGLLTSVFLWVYGLLSPFAGFLADRFNRSRVIICSLIIWSAVTWLTAHTTTFGQLLATRALMGISEACYIPAALALISDYHRNNTRSLATGIHMTGIMIGSSLAFVGGFIAEKYRWSTVFSVLGIIGIAYALVLMPLLKDVPKRQDLLETRAIKIGFVQAVRELFSNKSFIRIIAFWGLLGIVGWMVVGWLPTYYREHFKLSQGVAGLYATGFLYPASFIGVLCGGYLADRWSRSNARARIFVPAIGFCFAAPCIFFASSTTVLALALSFFVVYAVTIAFVDANMMPILCMVVDSRYRATAYGVMNLFSCSIGGIGLYLAGVLRDLHWDLNIMYKVAALTVLICAALLFSIKSHIKKFKST